MKMLTLALLAALLSIGTAWAQPAAPGPGGDRQRQRFGNADLNDDGTVDEVEAEQAAKQRVERLTEHLENVRKRFDTNGDGTLDENEQTALKNAMAERGERGPARMLSAIDADGDWNISADEEAEAVKTLAQRLQQAGANRPDQRERGGRPGQDGPQDPDANGDCIIDETEARVAAERRVDMMRRVVERLRERAQENPDMRYPPWLAQIDADQNYDISDAEAEAAVERIMAELVERNQIVLKYYDEDKDGKLDEKEQAAAQKAFAFMKEIAPPPPRFAGRGGPRGGDTDGPSRNREGGQRQGNQRQGRQREGRNRGERRNRE